MFVVATTCNRAIRAQNCDFHIFSPWNLLRSTKKFQNPGFFLEFCVNLQLTQFSGIWVFPPENGAIRKPKTPSFIKGAVLPYAFTSGWTRGGRLTKNRTFRGGFLPFWVVSRSHCWGSPASNFQYFSTKMVPYDSPNVLFQKRCHPALWVHFRLS